MKRSILSIFAFAMTAAFATAAFADVKVKSKQTVSGQSYESTTYIKGKRQRTESMGGMVNITQCDLRRGVQVNNNSQTYMVTPFATTTQTTAAKTSSAATDSNGVVQTGGRITTTITTKDTGERKQVFGYTARRLIITIETVSSPDACSKSDSKMQTDGWYIDAAFALDCDFGMGGYGADMNRAKGCQDKYDLKTLGTAKRGFPVYEKMTMFGSDGKESFSIINEVVEFSQAALDPGLFEIPRDFREVSDPSQMYAAAGRVNAVVPSDSSEDTQSANNLASAGGDAAAETTTKPAKLGPKKAGVVRIGVAGVKTGPVGEGLTASDLAAAVRNTFAQYLNVPNIEVVNIEAKLSAAIDSEAHSKECDFVAFLTVSHNKGGRGFGMFKSLAPMIGSVVPAAAGTAGTGGYIAGTVASQVIITSATVAGDLRNKDELTLDIKLNRTGSSPVVEKSFKAKAKSNGEDIISQVVQQAAQAVIDTTAK